MKILSVACSIFAIFASPLTQGQTTTCGRADWSNVIYDYFAGHRLPNPRDASVVELRAEGRSPILVVRKGMVQTTPYYNAPSYFQTADNGKTWQPIIEDAPSGVPSTPLLFFRAPSNPKVVYNALQEVGLYLRSADGGQSWVMPLYNIEGKSPQQVAVEIGGSRAFHVDFHIIGVHPTESLTLYAGIRVIAWGKDLKTHELPGIYRSVDGGENWTKFSDRLVPFSGSWGGTSPLAINPADPNVMFGNGFGGILKSLDGGKTWSGVGQIEVLEKPAVYRMDLKKPGMSLGAPMTQEVAEFLFDTHATKILYMLTNRGVFKTTDEGETWRLLDVGFDEINAINSVALNPSNSNELFIGSFYGIFVSSDGGCHFHRIPSPGELETNAKTSTK